MNPTQPNNEPKVEPQVSGGLPPSPDLPTQAEPTFQAPENPSPALPEHVQNAINNWGAPSSTHVEVNQQAVFTADMMPTAKKRRKWPLVLVIIILGLGLATVAVMAILSSQKTDVNAVFAEALKNSLANKNYELSSKLDYEKIDDNNIRAQIDISDTKDPKAYSVFSNLPSEGYTFESYSQIKQSYYKFEQDKNSKANDLPKSVIGKWIATDPNPEYSSSFYTVVTDVTSVVLGELIFGNFSDTDKSQLVDFALTNQVYAFDEKTVTKQKVGSKETLVYDVKLNIDKLVELNKTAGKMLGATDEAIANTIAQNIEKEYKSAKIFIDASTKTVVKTYFEGDGLKQTSEYLNFNTTQLPSKPEAELTEQEFFKFIESSVAEGDSEGELSEDEVSARSRDTERKSDMRAIQSKLAEFYALNGRYPISLNDSALGLPANACKAPGGSGTCSSPDYTYKAFAVGADISALTSFASSNAAQANATSTNSDLYILYTNSMEAQEGGSTFFQVSSSF